MKMKVMCFNAFYKLLLYSIEGIVAFSVVPLAVSVILGMLLLFIAVALLVTGIVFICIGQGAAALEFLPVFVSVMLSGVILLCMGINGQYLSKTYMEVKRRPIYIAKEESGKD